MTLICPVITDVYWPGNIVIIYFLQPVSSSSSLDIWTNFQVIVAPKVLLNKRNHRVVTDQEDVQERNWMNKGKVSLCSQMVRSWVSANLISSSSDWLIHFNKITFLQVVLILWFMKSLTVQKYDLQIFFVCGKISILGSLDLNFFYLRCKMRESKLRSTLNTTLMTRVRAGPPHLHPSLLTINWSLRFTKQEKMRTSRNISKFTKIRLVFNRRLSIFSVNYFL